MSTLYSRRTIVLSRAYVAIILVVATVLSPLALSFIPVLLLAWYLYMWLRPITKFVLLLTEYFMFFAITLLFTSPVGDFFAFLFALPVLVLINRSLEQTAQTLSYRDIRYARWPTDIGIAVVLIVISVLVVALLLGSLSLLLACVALVGYFGFLGVVIFRSLLLPPIEANQIQQRMVAGTEEHLTVEFTTRTGLGGLLFLDSPYDWFRLSRSTLSLKEQKLAVGLSLMPALSGPSVLKLKGQATDRWGLVRLRFELEPIDLYVIPRARYAAWLARRYMAQTKPGALPLISNISAIRPIYGLRRGVEYYGSQLYQPGDSLRNIDWKHSVKYNELITKEFAEFQGQSAVVLINLAVGDAEEADELAYKMVVTAISLAEENIPAALATYDHKGVKLTTAMLQPQQLILRSLQVAREIVTVVKPVKYLHPPDVARLRANISRIRHVESKASSVLVQLLQMEYRNLDNDARFNPATKALSEVFNKVDKQSNIVVVSQHNHDAEAIAFNRFNYTRKGNAVITV